MQTINIRNIALSLCLGLFSFYTYVANIHNVSTAPRGIASETCDLTSVSSTKAFRADSHKPTSCEHRTQIKTFNSVSNELGVKLFFKLEGEVIEYPEDGNLILDNIEGIAKNDDGGLIVSDELQASLEEHPKYKEALALASEMAKALAEKVHTEPASSEEVVVTTTTEERDRDRRDEPRRDEDEVSVDRVKDLIESYGESALKQCDFTNHKDFESLTEDLEDTLESSIGEDISKLNSESDIDEIAQDIAENISEEDLEELEDELSEYNKNKDAANTSEKVECLSSHALKIQDTAQQINFYDKYIRPEISQAVGGVENFDEFLSVAGPIEQNAPSFIQLQKENGGLIDHLTTIDREVAKKALACKIETAQAKKDACIQEMRNVLANLENALPSIEDPAVKLATANSILAYKEWIGNLTGTSGDSAILNGAMVADIINGNITGSGNNTTDVETTLLSEQEKILAQIKALREGQEKHLSRIHSAKAPENAHGRNAVVPVGNANDAKVKAEVNRRLQLDSTVLNYEINAPGSIR